MLGPVTRFRLPSPHRTRSELPRNPWVVRGRRPQPPGRARQNVQGNAVGLQNAQHLRLESHHMGNVFEHVRREDDIGAGIGFRQPMTIVVADWKLSVRRCIPCLPNHRHDIVARRLRTPAPASPCRRRFRSAAPAAAWSRRIQPSASPLSARQIVRGVSSGWLSRGRRPHAWGTLPSYMMPLISGSRSSADAIVIGANILQMDTLQAWRCAWWFSE